MTITKALALITLIVVMCISVTPALADTGDTDSYVYESRSSGDDTVWMVGTFDAGTKAKARVALDRLDAGTLEESFSDFDLRVTEDSVIEAEHLDILTADSGVAFEITSDYGPGLVVAVSQGSTIYVFIALGYDADMKSFAGWTIDVMTGTRDVDAAPAGFRAAK